MTVNRRGRLIRLLGITVAAALVGLTGGAAVASDSTAPVGRVDHVETDHGTVKVLFSIPGLPTAVNPDPSTVQVSFGGQDIDAKAQVQTGASSISRTSILTMDVSASMAGAKFAAAKQAALDYIDSVPADVKVGLVTFASTVDTVQAPTTDRTALTKAIDSLKLSMQTRLYDGVLQSLQVAGHDGQRTILLLSDGKNTTLTPTLSQVLTTAGADDVRIDVVGLNQVLTTESPLAQIADATGGSITSTSNPDELHAVFAAEADTLAKQLLITFETPADLSTDEGTLTVSVDAAGQTYTDNAFVTMPKSGAADLSPTYDRAGTSFSVGGPFFFAGIALLFVGVALLLSFGLGHMAPKAATPMQQQLSLYTVHGMKRAEVKAPRGAGDGVDLKQTAAKLADHLVVRRDLEDKIAKRLDAGGLKLKPAEWLLLHAAIVIGAGFLGLIISGAKVLVILLFLVLGAVVPWFYLKFKASRRIKKFNSSLAETLQILAGGLQAGLSLSQAVDTIVREGAEPIASEFKRAIIEQRLGVEIEDSLDTVAERMESVDFKWVVMAIRIQREVGGNLAELLLTVSATLREREYLRRQVQVLSAEGRLSAWILGCLPPLFVVYLTLTRPTYIAPMFHTKLGWVMCAMGLISMTIGAFWLKKAVKVEV